LFVGFEAWENLRLSRSRPWVHGYRWPIYFFVAVAFWNMVGAGLFGFMINPPVALYFMQGLNTTPVHGHTALFGVYGMLGIGLMLFCLRALRPGQPWRDGLVSWAFWLINIGLGTMVLLRVLPVGLLQTYASVETGYWWARSAEFLQTPVMHTLRWMRVIGDTATVTQALITGNVDAMVVPYSYADMAKRAGARSLADVGTVNMVFQLTVMCAPKDSAAINHETMVNLTKGIVDSLVFILDPANKRDVAEALKKNLRLSKDEDIEAAYKVARLQMPNLDVAPNLEAWRLFKRLVVRVNPKVQEADLDQIITGSVVQNLEASGFMAEMRKKLPR